MSQHEYEVVKTGLKDTAEAPRGRDLHYKCTRCDGVVPSQPKDNVGCECGNIFIDIDYHRLAVSDFANFVIVKRVTR